MSVPEQFLPGLKILLQETMFVQENINFSHLNHKYLRKQISILQICVFLIRRKVSFEIMKYCGFS